MSSPVCWLVTSTCLAKGIMAGLWVDLEASWAFASGKVPGVTCRQDWGSTFGSRRDFMVGCPRAAAVSGCEIMRDRWMVPHFAVRTCFDYSRSLAWVSLPVQRTPLWPASWLPVLDKSGGSKAAEVQRVWDVYDDKLQFMSRNDALNLDGSLANGDVSLAWMIWSSAVEAALADAYRFADGLVPDSGLVLGRGVFRSRTVRLGGPKVRRARRNFADSQEGSEVSLCHDVSTALLLDLRRRLKLVVDLLSAMIRGGVSLARSVELAVQWDVILRAGPIHPITAEDFLSARGGDFGQCCQVVQGLPRRLSNLFMLWLCIVGRRLFVVGEVGCVRIHLFILISGSSLSWAGRRGAGGGWVAAAVAAAWVGRCRGAAGAVHRQGCCCPHAAQVPAVQGVRLKHAFPCLCDRDDSKPSKWLLC